MWPRGEPFSVYRLPVAAGTSHTLEHGAAVGLEIVSGDALGARAYWRAPELEPFAGAYSLELDLAGSAAPWSGDRTWIEFPPTLAHGSSSFLVLRVQHVGPPPTMRNARELRGRVSHELVGYGSLTMAGVAGQTTLLDWQGDVGAEGVPFVRDRSRLYVYIESDTSAGNGASGDGLILEIEQPDATTFYGAGALMPSTNPPIGATQHRALYVSEIVLPGGRWRLLWNHAVTSTNTIRWQALLSNL